VKQEYEYFTIKEKSKTKKVYNNDNIDFLIVIEQINIEE
jgi:hypothetical protein